MGKLRKQIYVGTGNPCFGRKRPLSERKHLSAVRVERQIAKGERNPNWKGGITKTRKAILTTTEYKTWRLSVFVRDNYTCQHCGKRGNGELHAHHIKPWAEFENLRYEVSNGMTLCKKCHKDIHRRKDGKSMSGKWLVDL